MMAPDQVIELNVGGHVFTTLRSTLCKHEESMLCSMFSGDFAPALQDCQGRYFIDRDGTHFHTVLAFLREQPIQTPCSFEERSALTAEATYYQLQGLLDMLSLGHVEGDEPSPSKLSFTDLGRLHISEGRALLLADARARVGQWKLYRICEALTRFHFGERGISSQHARSDHRQSPNTNLFTSLTADLRHVSAFSLHKEYLGHQTETMGYPWSALSEPEGYSGSWKLADIAKSPSLVEIDADEFVHLVYTYAALFQTEMEARGLRLTSTVCFDHMYRGFFSVSVEPIIGVSA